MSNRTTRTAPGYVDAFVQVGNSWVRASEIVAIEVVDDGAEHAHAVVRTYANGDFEGSVLRTEYAIRSAGRLAAMALGHEPDSPNLEGTSE